MLRTSHFAACAIVAVTTASAQSPPKTLPAERVPGAVKHAGIYHVSTGTWTRAGGAASNFGPDTIYSNTAISGYFSSAGGSGGFAPGAENFDEGNVPSTANTNNPGNRDAYNVNCVEIGYCVQQSAGVSSWELRFYSSHIPCTVNSFPDATVDTGPVPSNGCWTVALDLTGSREFCLAADGGDGFDDDADLDAFGWSFRYTGTDIGTAVAGFLITGDPQSTDPNWVIGSLPQDGTNTYFGPASLCSPDEATGLRTKDFWWLEDPNDPDPGGQNSTSNCYWFGGYSNNNGCGAQATPYASWHLELQADIGPCLPDIISLPSGCESTPNSTGVNSSMVARGSAAVVDDDVTLTAVLPARSFGYFITAENAGFIPMPGGSSGNICLSTSSGGIGRFSNLATSSGAAGIIEISTAAGQWTITSIPRAIGAYAAFPGQRTYFQLWHRDTSPSGPTSNFTDGVVVTWQ